MGEAQPLSRMVNDIFCPPTTTEPSSFNVSALDNIILELKP